MATKKDLPMKVDAAYDVLHILQQRHSIPYHSRPFMWVADKYIDHVVKEALEYWEKGELYWLGVVLLYTGGDLPAISDAQHRLTIVFLMIRALANLLKESNAEYSAELLSWISVYGRASVLRTEIPAADKEAMTRYGWQRYPNIESCYDYDFEALGNVLNNIDDREGRDDSVESKIYAAYDSIYALLDANLSDENYTEFAQFLYSDVKITRISITDWQFSIVVFGSFNNIKVSVPASFLLKNTFAQIMGEEHSVAIHTVFEGIQRQRPKNYEQYIHMLANIYCGKLIGKDDYEKSVTKLIDPTTSNPLERFVEVDRQVKAVYAILASDPFGSIFMKCFASGHEVYTLCLVPLGVVLFQAGKQTEYLRFVRRLIAYGIRSGKSVCFNRLGFQYVLCDKIGKLLAGDLSWEVALTDLTAQLTVWLGPAAKREHCITALATEKYDAKKFHRVRGALLYLVEVTDRHEARIDHEKVHIEHIYPQKPSKKHTPLINPDNKHRIGNLTPFVNIGGTEEMKGNIELGNKLFEVKLPHYKCSNIALTRDPAKYESTGFQDAQIEARSAEIAALLETVTARDLASF